MSQVNSESLSNLYYVLDPMCSWCYAFAPSWQALLSELPDEVNVRYVMGGLAPDSDEPMPAEMRDGIAQVWRSIEQRTGAVFNHDFWQQNEPRRSTYPACRAALAAGRLRFGALAEMVERIQRGYYREARNPSIEDTLCEFAGDIGLDPALFRQTLNSEETRAALNSNLELTRRMGVRGFPAVVALHRAAGEEKPRYGLVTHGYCEADQLLEYWRKVWHEIKPA